MTTPERGIYPVGDGTEYRVVPCGYRDPPYDRFMRIEKYQGTTHLHTYRRLLPPTEAEQAARHIAAYYKGLHTIYEAGRAAALTGQPRTCPYEDARTYHNGVTWSRARIRRWYEGYDEAKHGN